MTVLAPAPSLERFARYRAWAPEWWLVLPIAAAWAVAAVHALSEAAAALSAAGNGALRAGQVLFVCLVPSPRTTGPDPTAVVTMSVAMMLPVALPAARHVARNSLRHRQRRAIIAYVGWFLAPVVLAGLAINALVDWLPADPRAILAGWLLLAAAYQLSPPKRRALADCRRLVPLPPDGRRADAAVARFGLVSSWRCIRSSWALMMPVAVLGASGLLLSILVTGLLLAEDPGRAGRRILRPSATILAVAALTAALVPLS